MVTATKPGTSVPVKILRSEGDQQTQWRERTVNLTVDELDLEAEQQRRPSGRSEQQAPEPQSDNGFGLMLGTLTPQIARELEVPARLKGGAVIMQVDPNGPAAGRLERGDVILSVNNQRVSTPAEAGRELQQVAAGRVARILIWRQDEGEIFLTLRKE
jgi:serine protease Do